MTLVPNQFYLGRSKMLDSIAEIEAVCDDAASSLYFPPDSLRPEIEDSFRGVVEQEDICAKLTEVATNSRTGVVVFWGPLFKYLIVPPFPIEKKADLQGYATGLLRNLVETEYKTGLVLVRLGAYAVGVCHGEKLISSKVGTGNIHGRHRKGGSSQMRFQRHREKQIESFLDRVCIHVQERLGELVDSLDYMVYGGAWTTISLLQKRCLFLRKFENCTLPPLLDIKEPRQMVLETAVRRIWSSRIVQWRDN